MCGGGSGGGGGGAAVVYGLIGVDVAPALLNRFVCDD